MISLDSKVLSGKDIRARLDSLCKRAGIQVTGEFGQRGMYFKSVSVENPPAGREIVGISTTDRVDFDREVVMPGGLNWEPLLKYRCMYVEHDMHMRSVAATVRSVKRLQTPNGWQIRGKMLGDSYSEHIPRLPMLAEAGVLGLSIGFMATNVGPPTPDEKAIYPQAESIVRSADVVEVSFTTMPCNLDCYSDVVYLDDTRSGDVMKMADRGLVSKASTMLFITSRATQAMQTNNAGNKTLILL